ncbi:hypothetical protein KDW49_28630 [Burkholderia dolosa]|nr:hypothetical protein [Burkholderia dolosa]PRH27425.1 hypothetical protein C6T71_08925 [Burkholderia multivorans]
MLDDVTLARIRQEYSEQREFLPVQREQFKRWQSEVSTPKQRDMLAHLTARADQLSALQWHPAIVHMALSRMSGF